MKLLGCIGVVWSILFIIFNADSPSDHKWINKAEVNYILESTKKTEIRKVEFQFFKGNFPYVI